MRRSHVRHEYNIQPLSEEKNAFIMYSCATCQQRSFFSYPSCATCRQRSFFFLSFLRDVSAGIFFFLSFFNWSPDYSDTSRRVGMKCVNLKQ
jgi:hypothetical protein